MMIFIKLIIQAQIYHLILKLNLYIMIFENLMMINNLTKEILKILKIIMKVQI